MIFLICVAAWLFYGLIQALIIFKFDPPTCDEDVAVSFWFPFIGGPLTTILFGCFWFIDWLDTKPPRQRKTYKDRFLYRLMNGLTGGPRKNV